MTDDSHTPHTPSTPATAATGSHHNLGPLEAIQFKHDCLKPYLHFIVRPECTEHMWRDHDWRLDDPEFINAVKGFEDVEPLSQPDVILLNGPAGSGKGWLGEWLQSDESNLDCVRYFPTEKLYQLMRLQELPMTRELSYDEFKTLPYGRERLIAASHVFRQVDLHVFNRMITNSRAYQESKLAVIDNVGFVNELEWFQNHSNRCALLTIVQPAKETKRCGDYERIAMFGDQYPDDSRFALENPGGHHLRCYDSDQAKWAIQQLMNGLEPLALGSRVAEIGEILRAAKRPEPAVTRGLFKPDGVSADGISTNESGSVRGD